MLKFIHEKRQLENGTTTEQVWKQQIGQIEIKCVKDRNEYLYT